MKKILPFLSLILTFFTATTVFAAPPVSNTGAFSYNDNPVSLIVELDAGTVPDLKEISFYSSADGGALQEAITEYQAEIFEEIKYLTGISSAMSYSYTHALNGFSIEAPESFIDKIKTIDGVKNVYINKEYSLPEPLIYNADDFCEIPDFRQNTELGGEGQIIAVIDCGLDADHDFFSTVPTSPALTKASLATLLENTVFSAKKLVDGLDTNITAEDVYVSEKIPFAFDYYNKNSDTTSENNHGTHVSGIAVGKDGSLTDGTKFSGVAPEAQLVFMDVENENKGASTLLILAALDDAVKIGVDVINLSLGSPFGNGADSIEEKVFENVRNAGIMVACAAGNSGRSNGFTEQKTELSDYSAVSVPSYYTTVTSVASANTLSGEADVSISNFSSWGSDISELKPEISTPGSGIYSSVFGGYGTSSGTSMASPYLAGLYALLNQYYEKSAEFTEIDTINYASLTGEKKVNLLENLLMSSATVLKRENVPYSPRSQGAGLANISAAVKTPVIVSGSSEKSSVALGDGLTNSFVVEFDITNISKNDVTYQISLELLADGCSQNTNNEYILGDSVSVSDTSKFYQNDAPLDDESITLSSGETATLKAQVTADSEFFEAQKKNFTNGFFIDGFVFLSTESEISDISVPFFGFCGDWDKAPLFDTPLYAEGGSTLSNDDIPGTFLFGYADGSLYPLGVKITEDAWFADEKYIAFSNGIDGLFSQSLGVYLVNYRHLYDDNAEDLITGTVYLTISKDGVCTDIKDVPLDIYSARFSGSGAYLTDSAIKNKLHSLDDGDYTITVSGYVKGGDKSVTHSFTLPLTIDSETPAITACFYDAENKTLTLTAKDNHYLNNMYLYYKSGEKYKVFDTVITEEDKAENGTVTKTFTLTDDVPEDISQIRVGCTDYAQNDLDLSLSDLKRNIAVTPKGFLNGENSSSFIIGFQNNTQNDISARLIAAYYDASDKLVSVKPLSENATLSSFSKSTFKFTSAYDITNAAYAKIYIWKNIADLSPIDDVYTINLN